MTYPSPQGYGGAPSNDPKSGKGIYVFLTVFAAVCVVLGGMLTGLIPALLNKGGPEPAPSTTATASLVTPNPVPDSPPVTKSPEPEPSPIVTTSLTPLPDLVVSGRLAQGVQFTAGQTATYRFQYKGGAYSTYPKGQSGPNHRPWRTAIFVYRGDRVPFVGEDIDKERADLIIADTTDTASQSEAIAMATGTSWVEMNLRSGEVITLAAVDNLYSYGDNPGSVTLSVKIATLVTVS